MTTPTASPSPAATDLATKYTPSEVEREIYQRWLDAKAFHAEPGKGQGPRDEGQGIGNVGTGKSSGDASDSPTALGPRPSALGPSPSALPYSIVIPPPNVTAALHMGHALNNTLQDILIRWRRMAGDNAMWMPGTDHAGIATQTVVDKRLQAEGRPALAHYKKLEADGKGGREQFIAKVEEWKDEYEARITNQLKDMGCSCDWDRQRFTMDEVCAAAVREAFFQLFKDGLIYRGKRLVNWDPVSQTALADDEVENEEVDGHFYYLRYPLVGDKAQGWPSLGFVTVATTRPETMLGDTAVAINPRDPRAAELRGKFVRLPIVNRIVPIIEDDYVVLPASTPLPPREGQGEGRSTEEAKLDPKSLFATGFLKVTPAHDPNDYDIGRRHNLPVINVMAPDASISKDHGWPADEWEAEAPSRQGGASPAPQSLSGRCSAFAHELLGKSREDARRLIVDWFRSAGLLEEIKPYKHSVGHSYRSHVPIEPYLSDQWYVKVTDDRLAGAALRAMSRDQFSSEPSEPGGPPPRSLSGGTGGEDAPARYEHQLRFHPPRYARTFQQWHENIRDWCISRQLWWGHRIPVWSRHYESPKEYRGAPGSDQDDLWDTLTLISEPHLGDAIAVAFVRDGEPNRMIPFECPDAGGFNVYVCLPSDIVGTHYYDHKPLHLRQRLEAAGFTQDPDVLDTWFSSALWPISTLGWPDPRKFAGAFPDKNGPDAALNTWNPSNVLCTAREIITLWVSRMVMFNIYFRGCLPFKDVFIHAMIQDGHGQKMSKTLGNGIDPLDIIHRHGSDAMRFTLAAMTTQTQDVRMTVEIVCPHCGQAFSPKFVQDKAGHTVAGASQECPACRKKMTSSYGVSSGKAKATDEAPPARNTSEKFDYGRNFANKLWNAVRFALSNVAVSLRDTDTASRSDAATLADQWILARLSRTVIAATKALEAFEFKVYADTLYEFIWRDFCDWYIEAIKPTIADDRGQQRVLVTVIDASLRLLHPVMPFITEKLWERLNAVSPTRGDLAMDGVTALKLPLEPGGLLIRAAWPGATLDEQGAAKVEARFEAVRQIVAALREVRATYKVPPRQKLACSIRTAAGRGTRTADGAAFDGAVFDDAALIATLAGAEITTIGPDTARAADAAATAVGEIEIYVAGLIDKDAERTRLTKRLDELTKSIAALNGRLSNPSYTDKAPPHLVQQTRDQLAAAMKEAEAVKGQVAGL